MTTKKRSRQQILRLAESKACRRGYSLTPELEVSVLEDAERDDYKNEVILIARRLLTPIGGAGTPMGRIVQRMAIEVCNLRGWS
jgi:hypothetical protein